MPHFVKIIQEWKKMENKLGGNQNFHNVEAAHPELVGSFHLIKFLRNIFDHYVVPKTYIML